MANVDLGMSLYDLNKQMLANEKPLDIIQFNRKVEEMVHDISKQAEDGKLYWMLLCHERRDYTIFIVLTTDGTIKEMKPTLMNRGSVLSIDKQEDGNYEIWIRDENTKENFAYYLFDYSFGIVQA